MGPSVWDILDDCLDLFRFGRKNAAKTRWMELGPDFQQKLIDFAICILENPNDRPDVVVDTLYGPTILDQQFYNTLPNAVMEFVNG